MTAMCVKHPEREAHGTCSRCGRFACTRCMFLQDHGICAECKQLHARELEAKAALLAPRFGALLLVQGLLCVALAWYQTGSPVAPFGLLGVSMVVFGVLTVLTRKIWLAGGVACALSSVAGVAGMLYVPVMALVVPMSFVLWRSWRPYDELMRAAQRARR